MGTHGRCQGAPDIEVVQIPDSAAKPALRALPKPGQVPRVGWDILGTPEIPEQPPPQVPLANKHPPAHVKRPPGLGLRSRHAHRIFELLQEHGCKRGSRRSCCYVQSRQARHECCNRQSPQWVTKTQIQKPVIQCTQNCILEGWGLCMVGCGVVWGGGGAHLYF